MGMVPVDGAVTVVNRTRKYFGLLQNEFIYGGHLTSLGSPILVVCSAILLSFNINLPLLLMAYLIPLIVYSLNYYGEREKDLDTNPERAALVSRRGKSYLFAIGLYALTLTILVLAYANIGLMAFIVALALGGLLYTVVFKDFTKKVPGLKNVYTSLVWAAGGAFFLTAYYSAGISLSCLFVFAFMFTKSLLNVIFFDLKDMEADYRRGLKTIPVVLGKDGAFLSLHLLNALASASVIAGVLVGALPVFALSLLALYAYTFVYLRKAKVLEAREVRLASYTFAEAEIMLWPVLLIVGRAVASVL